MIPLSPLSPPDQNHGQNQDQNGGDILAARQNDSTGHEITPPENDQNRAQKSEGGDSGHRHFQY
jgi:hypothetical protein